MKRFLTWQVIATLLITLVIGFFDLPSTTQSKVIPFAPKFFTNAKVLLGLDLQGGSQLDYKIDLSKVPEADRKGIIEGHLRDIEKKVNALGVAEPNIYTSEVAGETHIIVELADSGNLTQDDVMTYLKSEKTVAELSDDEKKQLMLQKAKATVGKSIQLEFKEEKTDVDPNEKDQVKENAAAALNRVNKSENYDVVGQEEQQKAPGKVRYETSDYVFESDINSRIKDIILALKPGEYAHKLVETGGKFNIDATGKTIEDTGLAIVKLLDTKQEVKSEKSVETSHILISYKGLDSADASITRTEDEAKTLAKDIKKKLAEGADFATLAQEYSDDKSNKDQGGRLEKPVTGDGTYVYDFEQAALALDTDGAVSDPVKTQFGFHLIKANKITEGAKETKYKYSTITFSFLPDPWKETGLNGKYFVHADVQLDQFYQPYVSIQFNEEGATLFEDITSRNVNKKVAIFVGGNLISAPVVNEKISGGSAQISGQFTADEAKSLAEDLNTGAIPSPRVLTGEYTIGATLGQEALNASLFAGLIGLILVMIFMAAYYKVPGLIANVSLLIYLSIFIFLIKSQLSMGWAVLISLVVFGFMVVRILNNEDSAWEKFMAFMMACAAIVFLASLLHVGVVLTLSGIAGIIISLGMAVDANVLIFERFREELKNGKTYTAALEAAFGRAWNAIRDSNFTTILICAVIFIFGSATIRGFAMTLATGTVVSMFTAITITRLFMNSMTGKAITQNMKLMGYNPDRKPFHFDFMKSARLWTKISAALVTVAIASGLVFGLNLGLDFTGGTLMEFKFDSPVTQDTLKQAFADAEKEINETTSAPTVENAAAKIDLSGLQIIKSSDTDFIVKSKYLTTDQHENLTSKLTAKLPKYTEPRFTTIGPVLGESVLRAAMIAILIAMVMIIVYV
ncbi:MAG: peptidylprolyl isomerase, partial [Candidatus Gracilibacteria bacterium]